MTKTCSKCKTVKSINQFCKNKGSRDGFHSQCADCKNKGGAIWYKKNKKTRAVKAKSYYQKNKHKFSKQARANKLKKYDLTFEKVEELLQNQNHVCLICNRTEPRYNRKLRLDHNHKTGKFRGFLCNNCNTGLGMFEDNPDFLYKAIEYLLEHNFSVEQVLNLEKENVK